MRAPLARLCLLLLLPATVLADVKLRPGDKPKDSTKDFIKDQKKNGYPTPEPINRTYAFTAGLSVVLELQAATSYLGQVKFLIKDKPLFGTLSEPRAHPSGESNRVLITYTHNGDQEGLNDKFTFQAKIGEDSASVPGVITLVGKRAAPKLEVTEMPQFRRLQPGQEEAGRFVVTNSGTAPYTATLKWPEPFLGPPSLTLAVNEKQTVMVGTKPQRVGTFRLDLELQPGVASSRVQSFVDCAQPFQVMPGSLTLEFDAAKGNRHGSVVVTNQSTEPLTLKTDCNARLKVVKEVVLGPKETQEVELELDGKDVVLFHGELWLGQEPARAKVTVHAEAEPAQVRVEKPTDKIVDFGKVDKGKTGEASFVLANDGGVNGVMKLSVTPPFAFAKGQSADVSIPSGGQVTVPVMFKPEQPGTFSATLTMQGSAGRAEMTLKGIMVDPKRPGSSAPVQGVPNPNTARRPEVVSGPSATGKKNASSGSASAPSAPVASLPPPVAPPTLKAAPAPTSSEPVKEGRILPSQMTGESRLLFNWLAVQGMSAEDSPALRSQILDRIPAIGLHEAGRTYITLSWMLPKIEPKQYLIQRAFHIRNEQTGMTLKSWTTVKDWEPVKAPEGVGAAKITGLEPGTLTEWRILGLDSEGKVSLPSDLITVATQPPLEIPLWVWGLTGALVLSAALLYVRRRRMLKGLKK